MRGFRLSAVVMAGALLGVACAKVPFTNRTIVSVIPRGTLMQLAAQEYESALAQSTPVKGTANVQKLREVGRRIAGAVNRSDFDWQYNLLREDTVNAWCMPGGRIAFYTGILPVLENEASMGFVMGHEVGHAVANHGAERMTERLGVQGALTLIDALLTGSGKVNPQQAQMIQAALGLGATVGIDLPFSRAQETEADVLGIMYMAKAGFPPAESIRFWSRMSSVGGSQPLAFLSDHPSDAKRQAKLNEWLPQAQKAYQRSAKTGPASLTSIW